MAQVFIPEIRTSILDRTNNPTAETPFKPFTVVGKLLSCAIVQNITFFMCSTMGQIMWVNMLQDSLAPHHSITLPKHLGWKKSFSWWCETIFLEILHDWGTKIT